jgi:hypothetical protein
MTLPCWGLRKNGADRIKGIGFNPVEWVRNPSGWEQGIGLIIIRVFRNERELPMRLQYVKLLKVLISKGNTVMFRFERKINISNSTSPLIWLLLRH